jgi:hypothetical protein
MAVARLFLLSPARTDGQRAALLLREGADFSLARQVRSPEGAPLGEVFSFLSGLYFRGKLAYATALARPRRRAPGVTIITATRGLVTPDTHVDLAALREFGTVDIATSDPRYLAPFARDAEALALAAGAKAEAVLLGSIATGKYVDPLLEIFGERLLFPVAFVGRGDMSRGGLLLRAAREGRELEYAPVAGAVRKGKRPPKLTSSA